MPMARLSVGTSAYSREKLGKSWPRGRVTLRAGPLKGAEGLSILAELALEWGIGRALKHP